MLQKFTTLIRPYEEATAVVLLSGYLKIKKKKCLLSHKIKNPPSEKLEMGIA